MFAQISNVEVVAVCGSGEQFLSLLPELHVDIAVVDLVMPHLDGPATIAAIKTLRPDVKCIGISSYEREDLLVQMVKAGATGYLSKEVNMIAYEKTITAVMKGETSFPETLQALLRNIA